MRSWKTKLSGLTLALAAAAVGTGFAGDTGKPIRKVADDYHYGPPLTVADLPDGRRMFQWEMRESMVVPRRASPYVGVDVYAAPGTPVAVNAGVPAPKAPDCIYTVYARWAVDQAAWIISDLKKPDITCV